MTRGKYAKRAEIRRDIAETEASEDAYKRQIVRLTKERDEARAERDRARLDWRAEVRVLQAQVREGTSARVEALAHELERMRTARDVARREVKATRDTWDRAYRRFHDALIEKFGMSYAEALEWFMGRGINPPGIYNGEPAVEPDDTVDELIDAFKEGPMTPAGDPLLTVGVAEHKGQRKHARRLGADGVIAIQRARGIR